MKKIIVNESVLRQIIAEMAKERKLVTEIKVADAYTRFYEGKIPQDIYAALMQGADKMTPFHKICLDSLMGYYNDNEIDTSSESWHSQYLEWANEIGSKWAAASNDARQLLLRYMQAMDATWDFSNFERIVRVTNTILSKRAHTEKSYSDNGLEVLYEDDNLLITCTTSYAASKKNYGDSHWCTASDIFGHYNGFKMFGDYTCNSEYEDDAILVQFVDKHDREKTIQVAFTDGLEIAQSCDFFDHEISAEDTKAYLDRIIGLDKLQQIIPWEDLMDKTRQMYGDEYEYWEEKSVSAIKKAAAEIKTKWKNGEYEKDLLYFINDARKHDWWNYFDNGINIIFNSTERYKAEGTYVCSVSYYGEYYDTLNDFEDSNDVVLHVRELVLVKKGVNDDYYIVGRIPNMWIEKAAPAFVVAHNDDAALLCSWSDFSILAKGRDALDLRTTAILLDEEYNYGRSNNEPYHGRVYGYTSGQLLYEGEMTNIDLWGNNPSFTDKNGIVHSLRNHW